MKTRFSTLDISAILTEINAKLTGLRLANVYDVNNKTYLLKLAKPDEKRILLMESGIRLHLSEFDWPKNTMPSGFSMKLRKHLKGRRFVSAKQLGVDRIVDIQFGSDEAAYHVILELYDRGNIILTDYNYTILTILRYRRDKVKDGITQAGEENNDVVFAVHEPYPVHAAKQKQEFDEFEKQLADALRNAKPGQVLKRFLNPHLNYGAQCIEHCLLLSGFKADKKTEESISDEDIHQLVLALREGEEMYKRTQNELSYGYIIQKVEKKSNGSAINTNIEFHPFLFKQYEKCPFLKFDSFNKAVDEYYGKLESQRSDMKIIQQEKSAYKKLENIKKDHEQRLAVLEKEQDLDIKKANMIELNLTLVDQAIHVVQTALANQIDWVEIWNLIKDAQVNGDQVALTISKLKLETNEITMALYEESEDDSDLSCSDEEVEQLKKKRKPLKVDIDLGLTAYSNAKKYYDKKKQAALKQQKTLDSSGKALKSAEKKTMQALKDAATIHTIQKARKTFWFEKFIWFISSENYLILGGRDAQQNEILVKKYLSAGDVYVHADLHGATSCVVKNPHGSEVPPKTLNEAGTMAICHSAAWNAKVVTSAWWVYHHQVSKTAPSGEYLTTGSFLIRGKKNYLPPSYLIYGFGILFKVDETCIWRHKNERKVITIEEDKESIGTAEAIENELTIEDSDEENVDSGSEEQLELQEMADESTEKEEKKESAQIHFPDTSVKLEYGKVEEENNENDDVIFMGDEEPVKMTSAKEERKPHMTAKERRDKKKKSQGTADSGTLTPHDQRDSKPEKLTLEQRQQPKRGQKNRAKKIKNKYKDQDEEERLMKMELLQQSQSQKAKDRKEKKNKAQLKAEERTQGKKENRPKSNRQNRPPGKPQSDDAPPSKDDGNDSDDERERILQNEHLAEESTNILSSLTGCPHADDILLFAIPVCAPYNTMQNYKFKVKLTPGNTKKGKGAKTALALFQSMPAITQLEKDHLRSIKDHDLSPNIPGKIKISAPHLQSIKRKK